MTQADWQQLESLVRQMTPGDKVRLLELISRLSAASSPHKGDPLLGLMSDDSELLDQAVESAYVARESHPLRLPGNE
jgi:hypothetical protein